MGQYSRETSLWCKVNLLLVCSIPPKSIRQNTDSNQYKPESNDMEANTAGRNRCVQVKIVKKEFTRGRDE